MVPTIDFQPWYTLFPQRIHTVSTADSQPCKPIPWVPNKNPHGQYRLLSILMHVVSTRFERIIPVTRCLYRRFETIIPVTWEPYSGFYYIIPWIPQIHNYKNYVPYRGFNYGDIKTINYYKQMHQPIWMWMLINGIDSTIVFWSLIS